MKRSDLTEKILDIKREKEWSWSYIAGEIGGYSEILIVSSLLGHMRLSKPSSHSRDQGQGEVGHSLLENMRSDGWFASWAVKG